MKDASKDFFSLIYDMAFWATLLPFVGGLLTYYFGIPDDIRPDGHGYLLLDQVSEGQIFQAKVHSILSHIGILMILIGFYLQIQIVINGHRKKK
jgi:Sec-independent protein secretion pathway component TatC